MAPVIIDGFDYHLDSDFDRIECAFLDRWLSSYVDLDEGRRGPVRKTEVEILAMLEGRAPVSTRGMEMYLKWRAARQRHRALKAVPVETRPDRVEVVRTFLDDRVRGLGRIMSALGEQSQPRESSDGRATSTAAVSWLQAMLASDAARYLDNWLTSLFEAAPTIYDRAVDATYLETGIGGGLHRLFDGSHTPQEMWAIVRDVLPDDGMADEVQGWLSSLTKDLVTPAGIPLVTTEPATYEALAATLEQTLAILRNWTADALTINGTELIASSIGIIAIALNWSRPEEDRFVETVGALGLTAAYGANPVLMVVAVVAFARAWHAGRHRNDRIGFMRTLAEGGMGPAIVVVTSSLIGGPAWIGLVAGLCLAITVRRYGTGVDLHDLSRWMLRIVMRAIGPTDAPA